LDDFYKVRSKLVKEGRIISQYSLLFPIFGIEMRIADLHGGQPDALQIWLVVGALLVGWAAFELWGELVRANGSLLLDRILVFLSGDHFIDEGFQFGLDDLAICVEL
jgi:hypothetical protein